MQGSQEGTASSSGLQRDPRASAWCSQELWHWLTVVDCKHMHGPFASQCESDVQASPEGTASSSGLQRDQRASAWCSQELWWQPRHPGSPPASAVACRSARTPRLCSSAVWPIHNCSMPPVIVLQAACLPVCSMHAAVSYLLRCTWACRCTSILSLSTETEAGGHADLGD